MASPETSMLPKIRAALKRDGWFRSKSTMSLTQYERLARQLGTIVQSTDIAVDPTISDHMVDYAAIVQSALPLGFHTDNPRATIISWFSAVKSEHYEPTLLLPSKVILDQLSASEKTRLQDMFLERPPPLGSVPIYQPSGIFNYSPNLAGHAKTWPKAKAALIHKIDRLIADARDEHTILVHLKFGEILVINNQTMLHGRGPLVPGTQRCLKRRWINGDVRPGRAVRA